jgi:hypothetical protein
MQCLEEQHRFTDNITRLLTIKQVIELESLYSVRQRDRIQVWYTLTACLITKRPTLNNLKEDRLDLSSVSLLREHLRHFEIEQFDHLQLA